MKNGETSLMLFTKMPDGSYVATHMSARMLHAIAGTMRGAQKRFGDIS